MNEVIVDNDFKFEPPKYRNLFFNKQVDQESIGELMEKIIEINDHDERLKKIYAVYDLDYCPKPIKIYIDSYGGEVYQSFGLLSIMECSKTPIYTIVTGAAMSCGFLILIHGHKRFGYELSTPLYHQIGSDIWGKAKDIEDEYMEIKRLQAKVEELTIKKTRITKKRLKEIYDYKKNWYMDTNEALNLGVIEEIIYKSKDNG